MKVIIAGSRNINNFNVVKHLIDDTLHANGLNITEGVCGEARGVDASGKVYCETYKIPVKSFPANWETYGKRAGPIRNEQMANYAEALIAIWDGKSKGTLHMIETMKKKNKPVFVHVVN